MKSLFPAVNNLFTLIHLTFKKLSAEFVAVILVVVIALIVFAFGKTVLDLWDRPQYE